MVLLSEWEPLKELYCMASVYQDGLYFVFKGNFLEILVFTSTLLYLLINLCVLGKMPRHCIVPQCTNNSFKPGLSFHLLPLHNKNNIILMDNYILQMSLYKLKHNIILRYMYCGNKSIMGDMYLYNLCSCGKHNFLPKICFFD